ncbi:MAG: response regulator [Ruminococcus sp.]|nr:response regulator [Ruminococcus sp.]
MKIMIADDHKLIVDDLLDEVSTLFPNATCVGTSDPAEVIPLFKEYEFDVIIMDIDLADVSGIELADEILKIKPRTNIIYITGHSEFALESYKTYASAFLVKPISGERLRDAFEHLRHPVSTITDDMIESEFAGNATIGKWITKYREERGMSRDELAEKMHVALQTVYRWENGKRMPDVITFMKLANILGVDMGNLLNTEE